MSSVLDVRTRIYCNLGTVISGSLQEGTIVGAGLINVTGSVLLDGVYRVRPGSVVELSYYKNGRMTRLGRKLRAISVYANPVTRTTEVQLGCKLTLLKDSEPPPQVFSSLDDADTEDLTGIEKLLMIKPTSAKFVAERCCKALKIEYDQLPLTNQFYQENFKISGKYLNTLSDLLISEGYVGYLNGQEKLKLINIKDSGGSGPVLDETKIISIEPINSGDPDADVVYSIVNYKKVKLDAAVASDGDGEDGGGGGGGTEETVEEILERNNIDPNDPDVQDVINSTPGDDPRRIIRMVFPYWANGYEDNGEQTVVFRHKPKTPKDAPEIVQTLTYGDNSEWIAKYSYDGQLLYRRESVNTVWGRKQIVSSYSYWTEGGANVKLQTTYKDILGPEIVLACGFPPEVVPPLPAYIIGATSTAGGIGEIIRTKTVTKDGYSITTESRTAAHVLTADGAANIQQILNSYTRQYKKEADLINALGPNIGLIVRLASALKFDKTRVSFSESGKPTEYTYTVAPSGNEGTPPLNVSSVDFNSLSGSEQEDLINRELETELSGDPSTVLDTANGSASVGEITDKKNGYTASVVDVPEIIFTGGESGRGVILELTPPYSSDDKIVKVGDYYKVIPSDATKKAKAFARIQNKLRYGYRNGQAVVFPIEFTPIRPFSPLYLKFGGVTGQYRSDRLNIVFDSSGILVSTDAIFWGGVGQ